MSMSMVRLVTEWTEKKDIPQTPTQVNEKKKPKLNECVDTNQMCIEQKNRIVCQIWFD